MGSFRLAALVAVAIAVVSLGLVMATTSVSDWARPMTVQFESLSHWAVKDIPSDDGGYYANRGMKLSFKGATSTPLVVRWWWRTPGGEWCPLDFEGQYDAGGDGVESGAGALGKMPSGTLTLGSLQRLAPNEEVLVEVAISAQIVDGMIALGPRCRVSTSHPTDDGGFAMGASQVDLVWVPVPIELPAAGDSQLGWRDGRTFSLVARPFDVLTGEICYTLVNHAAAPDGRLVEVLARVTLGADAAAKTP